MKIKGSKSGRGGSRKGSGRPMNWMREEARKIYDKAKVLRFYGDVVENKVTEEVPTKRGIVEIKADVKSRILAGRALGDMAYGKNVVLTGGEDDDGKTLPVTFRDVVVVATQALKDGKAEK